MRKVTLHEEADAEVNEAAKYYEEREPGLGLLFLAAVEEAVEKVLANPEAFQLVGDEIRRKIIGRFPYSLLYVIEPDRIRVIAVAHQRSAGLDTGSIEHRPVTTSRTPLVILFPTLYSPNVSAQPRRVVR